MNRLKFIIFFISFLLGSLSFGGEKAGGGAEASEGGGVAAEVAEAAHEWIIYGLKKPGSSRELFITGTIHTGFSETYLEKIEELIRGRNIKNLSLEYKYVMPWLREDCKVRDDLTWHLEDEIIRKFYKANGSSEFAEEYKRQIFFHVYTVCIKARDEATEESFDINDFQVSYINSSLYKQESERILEALLSSKKLKISGVAEIDVVPEAQDAELSAVASIGPSQTQDRPDLMFSAFEHLSLQLVMQINYSMFSQQNKQRKEKIMDHHVGVRNKQLAKLLSQHYHDTDFEGNILAAFGAMHVFASDDFTGNPSVMTLLKEEYDLEVVETIKIPGSCPSWYDASLSKIKDPLYVCRNCKSIMVKESRCSRCKVANYCSRKCQKRDWNEHKKICKAEERAKSPS